MEIRAKISLAVEQFKTNAALVGGLYKGMTADAQKHTQNVDKLIQKNLSNRINAANAGKAHDMSKLSEFEKAAVRSSRKMADEAMRAGMNGAYEKMDKTRLANIKKVEAQVRAEQDKTSLMRRDRLNAEAQAAVRAVKRDEALLDGIEKKARARHVAEYDRIYQIGRAKRLASQVSSKIVTPLTTRSLDSGRESKMAADALHKAHLNSEAFNQSLGRTRYALYDIGSKLLGFGLGIAAGLGQAIQQAAAFESAFTRVERTSGLVGSELASLRKSLIDLSTTMPVSFEQITAVATLGAQMGIAADSIDSFTKTVTKFSSITGVSVEEVATSLGRLGQLLDVPASKFENLSSAIAFVGVNAVATDREILVMSESISAAANQAGFAADEVIGLSGALASLKVRPEEARGVIVRLFREIDSSVSEGGVRLDDFAQTIGRTSEEAANLWKSNPSQFLTSFLSAAKAGGTLNETISALGITNSRELNVIQRLANNTDVLASTMADAHEQYVLGTYASDAYGKVQDDLASKMTIFQNVMNELQASFGETFMGPLKTFFDFIIGVGKGLAAMPAPMKMLIGILAALASGFLIFKGAMLLAVGGLLAMKLAMQTMGFSSVKSMASLSTLRTVMGSTGATGAKAALSIRILSLGMINQAKAATLAAASTRLLGNALLFVQRAFAPLLIISTVVAGIASLMPAADGSADSAKKLGDAMLSAGGGAEELMNAILLDTQAMNENQGYIGKLTVAYSDAAVEQEKLKIGTLAYAEQNYQVSESLKSATLGEGELKGAKEIGKTATDEYNKSIAKTNDILKEQEYALGANTAAFMNNALTKYGENSDKNFYQDFNAMANKPILEATGFNIAEMIAAGMKKQGGSSEYVANIQTELTNLSNNLKLSRADNESSADVVEAWGKQYGKSATEVAALTTAIDKGGIGILDYLGPLTEASKGLDALRISQEQVIAAQGLQKKSLIELGVNEQAADDIVTGLSETLKKYASSAAAIPSSNAANLSSFKTFSDGIKETDGDLSVFTENGRNNMENFRSFMTSSLAAAEAAGDGFAGGVDRIASGLSVLGSQGIDTGAAFDEFQTYMNTAATAAGAAEGGFTNVTKAIREAGDLNNLNGLISGMITAGVVTGKELEYALQLKTALEQTSYAATFLAGYMTRNTKTISNAAKAVKTLSQYASEVGNLMRSSIDIKFSKDNGIISLKNAMADINKNIKDAKDNLRDLQSTVAEKQTKRQQLGIDLQLARQFGDTAGVTRITDEMAAIDREIAATQEDIAYNTDIATGSLDLNTQAGRDNLQAIQNLTTAGSDYIEGLINSGAPQATVLKAIGDTKIAFENQLKAMGLSKAEIDKYSTAFDGFVTIVKKAPKDVTVTANTNPAVRVLNDFIALANKSKATVTIAVKAPSKEERLAALKTEQTRLATSLGKYKDARRLTGSELGAYNMIKGQKDSVDALIKSGNYANGGLIQGTGGNKQDNIVIGASRNEFMMSAGAVQNYGVDFMNALNQQRVGVGGSTGGFGGGGGSSQVVYLSARDRELLQAAVNRPITLKTSNRVIAQSANEGNKELAKRGSN